MLFPSFGSSRIFSSTILTSTSGIGVPALSRTRSSISASDSSSNSSLGYDIVRTGAVSLSPYPAMTLIPSPLAASASSLGRAEPPTMTFHLERALAYFIASGWLSIKLRAVGTMWEKVTCSLSIIDRMLAGSYLPASTTFWPDMAARYGMPQPWTWKNGTMGRKTSAEVTERGGAASAVPSAIVWRTSWRWLNDTPFGNPVVPDV